MARRVTRYSPIKLPIAAGRTTTFVYVDPGNQTDTELRHWRESHEKLWNAIRARNFRVHVAGITQTIEDSTRASILLKSWALEKRVGGIFGEGRTVELTEELKEIHRAVEQNTDSVLSRYGGEIGAMSRHGEIRRILDNKAAHHVRIDTYEIWNSRRVAPRHDPD